MRIVAVDVLARVVDVAHREKVELLLSCATSRIDREENGPGDAGTQET